MKTALVIGAGPAGLMAAEVLGRAGVQVTIAEAMPSAGRKFLMAGKSGLNLTKSENSAAFLKAYSDLPKQLATALRGFGPKDVEKWAGSLDQGLFTGSTGRVFPKAMKASPLLRSWLGRLASQGASLKTRTRWQGWNTTGARLATPTGNISTKADIYVLAMGGASWSRLGSDGNWAASFGDSVVPFAPANMGFAVAWSDHMQKHFGQPVKSTALHAGNTMSRGEWVISARGIEGGGVYAVSKAVREGAALKVDLLPEWSVEKVRMQLDHPRGKSSLTNHLRKRLRLDPVRIALLSEFGRPFPDDLAALIKRLPITHQGPRPLDEAISTAGGLKFDALTENLMLKDRPGTFACGEMLDWEAPTGGYLLTACLATGVMAAKGALAYLDQPCPTAN